jgi:hypothetical protein
MNAQYWYNLNPVYLRVTAEGKVDIRSFDSGVPCEVLQRDTTGYKVIARKCYQKEGVGKVDTAREIYFNGDANELNCTSWDNQDKVNFGSLYPEKPEADLGGPSGGWKNDTILDLNYYIHGWVCSNGGEYSYSVSQEWHFDKKRTRIEKVIEVRDTHVITWRYSYFPNGKMKMIYVIDNGNPYKNYISDTSTTEFIYDKNYTCTTICKYNTSPVSDSRSLIAFWSKQVDSTLRLKGRPYQLDFKYNGIRLLQLLTYDYRGKQLNTTLGYTYEYGFQTLFTDTLYYNAKEQLELFRSCSGNSAEEFRFAYDKKGRVISKYQCHYSYINLTGKWMEFTDTYEYEKTGKVYRISVVGDDPYDTTQRTIVFQYSK